MEFEEKMFQVEEVADDELPVIKDKTFKSAKSIVVKDGQQLLSEIEGGDKKSNHSSPREFDIQMKKEKDNQE